MPLCEQALDIRKKELGDHSHTATLIQGGSSSSKLRLDVLIHGPVG
jgi:hypothetical protein